MLACQYYNINYKKIMIDEVNVLKKGFDNEKYLKMQSEHITTILFVGNTRAGSGGTVAER